MCLFPIWPPDCRRREEGQRGLRRKNRQSWGQGAFWSLREPICSWLSKTKGRRKKKKKKHTKGRRRMWWMMTNEGGHYCSKKSDDICGNVCGQVFFNFLFFFFKDIFFLKFNFPHLGLLWNREPSSSSAWFVQFCLLIFHKWFLGMEKCGEEIFFFFLNFGSRFLATVDLGHKRLNF